MSAEKDAIVKNATGTNRVYAIVEGEKGFTLVNVPQGQTVKNVDVIGIDKNPNDGKEEPTHFMRIPSGVFGSPTVTVSVKNGDFAIDNSALTAGAVGMMKGNAQYNQLLPKDDFFANPENRWFKKATGLKLSSEINETVMAKLEALGTLPQLDITDDHSPVKPHIAVISTTRETSIG